MTPSWAGGRPGPQLGLPPPSRASLPPQVGDLRVSFSYAGLSSDDPDLGPAHVVSGSPGGQGGPPGCRHLGPGVCLGHTPSHRVCAHPRVPDGQVALEGLSAVPGEGLPALCRPSPWALTSAL